MAEQGRLGTIFKVARNVGSLVQRCTELGGAMATGLDPLLKELQAIERQVQTLVTTLEGARDASFSAKKPAPEIPIVEVPSEEVVAEGTFSDSPVRTGGTLVGS